MANLTGNKMKIIPITLMCECVYQTVLLEKFNLILSNLYASKQQEVYGNGLYAVLAILGTPLLKRSGRGLRIIKQTMLL